MKKELRFLALLLTLSLVLTVCGCKATPNDNSSLITSEPEAVSSEPLVSSEPETASSEIQSEPTVSVVETPVVSKPTPAPAPTPTPTLPSRDPIYIGEYTVNDPDNTRNLSTVRKGCYFGEAKDGKAGQPAINMQNELNSMPNVKALTLDQSCNDNRMYLTFDCGYEYNNLTASILDTLKEKNVKAVFFCTLSYFKRNPQLVSRMINEGHIVGNHSATHPDFTTISRTEMAKELYEAEKYLAENFGYRSTYFRFPSGNYSENCLELVTSVGYKSIFWSFAYKDWLTAEQPDPTYAFNKITSSYHNGAVLLLHAVSKTNTDILGSLIDDAHAKGYTFKSLDEYFAS